MDTTQTEVAGDTPVPFGYKMGWFAARTTDMQAVADALELQEQRPVDWRLGIDRAYQDSVFITPAVAGWILIAGRPLPWPENPKCIQLLQAMSTRLGHVQFFCTHRVVEFHGWAKATDGTVERAYAGDGDIVWNIGTRTPEELELNILFFEDWLQRDPPDDDDDDWDDEILNLPDEETVMQIAGKWGIDPTKLDRYRTAGPGILGSLPPQWRTKGK
jgi:hypothetical protein